MFSLGQIVAGILWPCLCVVLHLCSSNHPSEQSLISCTCLCAFFFIFHFARAIICPVCLRLSACRPLSLKIEREWVIIRQSPWKLDVQIRVWMFICMCDDMCIAYKPSCVCTTNGCRYRETCVADLSRSMNVYHRTQKHCLSGGNEQLIKFCLQLRCKKIWVGLTDMQK